jgi:hypothetical protein
MGLRLFCLLELVPELMELEVAVPPTARLAGGIR